LGKLPEVHLADPLQNLLQLLRRVEGLQLVDLHNLVQLVLKGSLHALLWLLLLLLGLHAPLLLRLPIPRLWLPIPWQQLTKPWLWLAIPLLGLSIAR
jgi:hypothetical protein